MPPNDDIPLDQNGNFIPNYPATENSIAAQRRIAEQMYQQSMQPFVGRSGPFEVVSPWGGAAMMSNALAGKLMLNRANSAEKQLYGNRASEQGGVTPYGAPPGWGQPHAQPQNYTPPDQPGSTPGPQTSLPPQPPSGMTRPWASYLPTYAAIESGNNPNARTGKYAGLYQFSPEEQKRYGNNYAAYWQDKANEFQRVYGRQPTGAELYLVHQQGMGGFQAHMSNPDAPAWQNMASTAEGKQKGAGWARQAIWGNVPDSMKQQFGTVDNITSRQFANMWDQRVETGRFDHSGGIGHAQAAQPTQVASLSGAVHIPEGAGAGTSPSPDQPPPSAVAPGAQNVAPQQVAGGPKTPMGQPPVGGQGIPTTVPTAASPQGQFLNPATLPGRQPISRREMMGMLANPTIPEEQKAAMYKLFLEQFQPQSVKGPGGWTINYGPNGAQQAVRPEPHWGIGKAGDTELPIAATPNLEGGVTYEGVNGGMPGVTPQGAGSNIPAAPSFDIGGGKNDISNPSAPPQAPASIAPHSEAEPRVAPNKVASLETGTASDAPPPGILGTEPPSAGPALANKPPGIQTAQQGATNPFDLLKNMGDYSQKRALSLEMGKKEIETYLPEYQKAVSLGQTAQTALPQIDLLTKLFKDPKLIQGPLSGIYQKVNDVIAGLSGDEKATQASGLKAAVDKLVAGGILKQLTTELHGVGQIRVAEINLLNQASASTYNTPAANAVILAIAKRMAQRASDIGKIAEAYKQGARWDKDGHAIDGPPKDSPTLTGQNDAINNYMRHHPTMDDNEIAALEKQLTEDPGRQKRKQQTGFPVPPNYTTTKPTQAQ